MHLPTRQDKNAKTFLTVSFWAGTKHCPHSIQLVTEWHKATLLYHNHTNHNLVSDITRIYSYHALKSRGQCCHCSLILHEPLKGFPSHTPYSFHKKINPLLYKKLHLSFNSNVIWQWLDLLTILKGIWKYDSLNVFYDEAKCKKQQTGNSCFEKNREMLNCRCFIIIHLLKLYH